MPTLTENLEELRLWRENNDRKSREIIDKWNEGLGSNVDKFGKELHLVLEQVAVAALDCFENEIAKECIKRLSKEFPKSLRVKKLESMWLEANENYDGAIKLLDEIIKVDDTNSAAKKRKVCVYKAQGKNLEAIKELTEYLKIFMADAEAWQELGELYLAENELNKAVFCFEELVLHNPHNHLLYQRLGDIRYTQGGGLENLEQARAYYCQSIKLNPKNLRALYGLYLITSNLSASTKVTPQKKKENGKLASWCLEEINTIYGNAKLTKIEERIAAITL